MIALQVDTSLTLQTPPLANVIRYDSLRIQEVSHVK
jgi:hypothetical protein